MTQFTRTGACDYCGAGIYVPALWMATVPPAPHYTCNCPGRKQASKTTFWPPRTDVVVPTEVSPWSNSPTIVANDSQWTDNFVGKTQQPDLRPQAVDELALDKLGDALEADDEVNLSLCDLEDDVHTLELTLENIWDLLDNCYHEIGELKARIEQFKEPAEKAPLRKMGPRKKKRRAVLRD